MIVLVGMLLAGCQERNEKVECREMVGRGVAAQSGFGVLRRCRTGDQSRRRYAHRARHGDVSGSDL